MKKLPKSLKWDIFGSLIKFISILFALLSNFSQFFVLLVSAYKYLWKKSFITLNIWSIVVLDEPKFIYEPPNRVDFFNTMEVIIECKASISSQISWYRNDGTNWSLVNNITGLRIIRSYDNALVFSSFHANDYNPSVHSSIYRCFASNSYGTIASRNVFVRGGLSLIFDSLFSYLI